MKRHCKYSVAIQIDALHLPQVVTAHLAVGKRVEVMPGHRAEPKPVALLYPHRQHLSRRLKVFADWLEPLLKERLFA
ncbi:hypothetical protein B5U98_25270 [Bosea sp. Tri-39]|nr:hypothetical protein B5U98_25270 [Bosea sp. Tri-39]RXT40770.1 hypothetical protein B5U99_03140 [Bosea sp. Tri-54]